MVHWAELGAERASKEREKGKKSLKSSVKFGGLLREIFEYILSGSETVSEEKGKKRKGKGREAQEPPGANRTKYRKEEKK